MTGSGVNQVARDELITAEFVIGEDETGFGMTGGIWGAGPGVDPPNGDTVRERAEVLVQEVVTGLTSALTSYDS